MKHQVDDLMDKRDALRGEIKILKQENANLKVELGKKDTKIEHLSTEVTVTKELLRKKKEESEME